MQTVFNSLLSIKKHLGLPHSLESTAGMNYENTYPSN